MADLSQAKNYTFQLVDKWIGYNSANDKTNVSPSVYVQGSQNVYKKISGLLANRPGLLRIGDANTTESPVSSEFIWNTSWGAVIPVWVTNGTIQARYNDVWYTLDTTTETRYVFDKWYDPTQAKDTLLFVNGTSNLYQWTGGITDIASGNNNSGAVGALASVPTAAGSGYVIGDILTITTGGTGATAEVTSLGTGAILTVSVSSGVGGRLYKVGDVLQIAGGSIATGGSVTVASVDSDGQVLTVTLTTSGLNYSVSNYPTSGGSGNGCRIKVDTVATGGSITGVKLLTPGSGYTTGTGKATSGGTGSSATLNIAAIATGSILKTDTSTTFQQNGFATSGTINVGGTVYTYTYNTGVALVGVTPDPSSIVAGVGFQPITTYANLPSRGFNSDFLKVINNQVYIGSYDSRLCYISSNTDFTNYIVPTPRISGSPELLTLDSTLNGIGVRQGVAYISIGSGEWASITFSDITVGTTLTQKTTVDVKPEAKLAAAYAHEFIGNIGDNIVYLAKDQQIRTLGDFNNSFVAAYPSLSQEISTELMAENFTGGGIKCIADFTYVTAPVSGKTYLYQVRQAVSSDNQVVVERLWHSPFTWNATRVDEISGTVVAFSNANPQVYQVWDTDQYHDDSPSDEPLPYTSTLAFSYRSGRRQGMLTFDKVFSEGYITEGTLLNLTINYDYEGATSQITVPINSISNPAYLFAQSVGSLGDSSLGNKPLGDEIEDQTTNNPLPKFKVINSLGLQNYFEYQLIYSSDTADSQWELLCNGTNAVVDDANATFITNKLRT